MKYVVHAFFTGLGVGQFSFPGGMRLPDGRGGVFALRGDLHCCIMDEKAHKECRSTKGAAGTSCCALRSNICNSLPEACQDDDYIFHCATATPEAFHRKTDDRAWELVEGLLAKRPL
eukprot:5897747-Pyramimonas_sp.AAC.1